MTTLCSRFAGGTTAVLFAATLLGTANAGLVVPSDDYLTSSDQISSPSNNPYWTGGFRPQVVAGVNLTKNTVGYDWTKTPGDGGNIYNNGAALAGKTINGIGFTDIVLVEDPDPAHKDGYGQSAVLNRIMYGVPVTNGEASGITMDYDHGQSVFYGRNLACAGWPASVGGASIGLVTDVSWWGHAHMGGADATNTFDMAWSTISGSSKWFIFHGLTPSNEVLVQLIAGQHGWNQTAVIRLNGVVKDANWQSAKTYQNTGEDNRTDYGAGLAIVAGTADSSGDLTVSVDVGGEFAVSAIIVQQKVEAATKLLVTLPGEAFVSGVGNSGTVSGQLAGVSFNITLSAVMADGVTLDTVYSGPRTVAYSGPGTPSGGSAPTYATNVTFSGGQAELLPTKLTKAETVKITPAISGLTGLQSSSVTVSPSVGAAERLAFITSPSGGVTNEQWAGQPVVALEDAEGNTVTGTAQNVTLAIESNPALGVLSGTKTVAATNGLAIFFDLSIDKVGVGYTLAATGSTVSNPVISDTFDITDAARTATRLLVTLPGQTFVSGTGNTNFPNMQYAGVPFDIVLTAVDDAYERCTSYTNVMAVTYSGPGIATGGAAPTYTTNVTFLGGRAAGLATTLTAAEYTQITPSVAGLAGVTSSVVRVSPGVGSKLAYSVIPSNGVAGDAFSVTVRSLDDNGNPASPLTDTLITLSVATGAGSLSGTLAGLIPSGANIVTFSAPVYSEAGTMTMTASGIGMTPITSGNIVFSAIRPSGTIRVSFDYMAEGRDIDAPAYFPSDGFDGGAPAVAAGFVSDEKNIWTAYDVRGWNTGGRSGYYFKSGMSAPVAGANGGSFYDSRSGELTGIKMVSFDSPSYGGPNPSGMSDLEKLNENFAYEPTADMQLSGLAPSTDYQIWMYGGGGTAKNGPFADTRWSVDGGATWSALVDGHSAADDGRGVMVYFKSSATGTATIKQDGENWSSNRDGSGADPARHSTYTPGFMLQKKPPRASGTLLLIR